MLFFVLRSKVQKSKVQKHAAIPVSCTLFDLFIAGGTLILICEQLHAL